MGARVPYGSLTQQRERKYSLLVSPNLLGFALEAHCSELAVHRMLPDFVPKDLPLPVQLLLPFQPPPPIPGSFLAAVDQDSPRAKLWSGSSACPCLLGRDLGLLSMSLQSPVAARILLRQLRESSLPPSAHPGLPSARTIPPTVMSLLAIFYRLLSPFLCSLAVHPHLSLLDSDSSLSTTLIVVNKVFLLVLTSVRISFFL